MNDQNLKSYYHPPSIVKVVQEHIRQCKNLALILDKYVERKAIDENKEKGPWMRDLLQSQIIDTELAHRAYQRWRLMLKSLDVVFFDDEAEWHIVVGLGGESVLETKITLHHLYGIPIIPGSALKGLTRAYVTGEEKDYFVPIEKAEAERKPSLEEKTDHPDIQRIFGMQERAGTVLFFDALPKNGKAAFVVDIMNPHYPDYYNTLKSNDIAAPANNQSPNPIPFLTVKEGTTFTFALAPRDPNDSRHRADVALAERWLQKALRKYGVGGKTSAGYGYFKDMRNMEEETFQSRVEHQTVPVPTPIPRRKPIELPTFRTGQEIMGIVASPAQRASALQFIRASDADKLLLYQDRGIDYHPEDVVILVKSEHSQAQNWKECEQRRCEVIQVEQHNGHIVLVCKPVQSKFGNKKKRS